MRNNPIYVVDLIGEVVSRVNDIVAGGVHYQYGHPLEVVNNLLIMGKNTETQKKKYPMIALLLDADEVHSGEMDFAFEVSLHIIIATWTSPNYKADKRYIESFKKTLYPLYDEFMYQVARSGYFIPASENKVPHTKTDRLYWGKTSIYGNTGNTANDFIDAIELTNFKLKVNHINCQS